MSSGKTGIAVVSIPDMKFVAEIPLPNSPQGFAVEKQGRRMFVNIPDANRVAVINRHDRNVIATWALDDAGDNFPMALDGEDERFFIATRTPAQMLALDTRSGKIISRVPCVGDADDMWYDGAQKRIYISGSEGFISVIQQQNSDHYALLYRLRTARGAANSALSVKMKSLYVGLPRRNRDAAEIRVYRTAP